MKSSSPSMNIAGVIGALYFTASSGVSVMSITLHARSGTSPFIPSRTEMAFFTSKGVQHDAIRTSTSNLNHHRVTRGLAFLTLPRGHLRRLPQIQLRISYLKLP